MDYRKLKEVFEVKEVFEAKEVFEVYEEFGNCKAVSVMVEINYVSKTECGYMIYSPTTKNFIFKNGNLEMWEAVTRAIQKAINIVRNKIEEYKKNVI